VVGNVGRVADALPGRPPPLGATPRDGGTNFAVWSSVAEEAQVCLLDSAVPPARAGQVWQREIDSFDPAAETEPRQAGDKVTVGPRSVTVLRGPWSQRSEDRS
jgi:pullulanase/glycogen debranching enzyme